MPREGGCDVVRQGRSIALVVAFLIGCAVVLMAGASGVQAEASQQNKQEHTEAAKEQGQSGGAASEGGDRCEGTRKINVNLPARFTSNDLPGCPQGGLLLGTDKPDLLAGEKGDDEVRGLGGSDDIMGGDGNDVLYGGSERDGVGGYDGDDVIYGGPGNDGKLPSPIVAGHGGDDVIYGGPGDDGNLVGFGGNDVIYGGPGDDTKLDVASQGELGNDGQRDKLYCGEGRDTYYAEKIDYVASSCEVKLGNSAPGPDPVPLCGETTGDVCRMPGRTASASASGFPAMRSLGAGGGPDLLLPAAALLLGSGILTYAILRRR
jgi:Ca2+-binding RTX toxin-like protein